MTNSHLSTLTADHTKVQCIAEAAALATLWAAKQYGYGHLAAGLSRQVAVCVTEAMAAWDHSLSPDDARAIGVKAVVAAIENQHQEQGSDG
jgi:hypothetical protein